MATSELAEFNRRIKAWTRKHTVAQGTLLQRTLALEALRRLVLRTPVRTGRARGGWQLTIDRVAEDDVDRVDKRGQTTINEGMAALGKIRFGCIVWIANNVEYIQALEDGHSKKQAPRGMFRITVQDLNMILRSLT